MVEEWPSRLTAVAIVGGRPLRRRIVDLFIALSRTAIPVAIFEEPDEARDWAMEFLAG
jgi:hypothetical protein